MFKNFYTSLTNFEANQVTGNGNYVNRKLNWKNS